MNLQTIANLLQGSGITVLESATSTNDVLRAMAYADAPDGTTIVALHQTAGKGRMGRSFFSPDGGLYWSILLRPSCTMEECLGLTPMAAVAVHECLQEVFRVSASIKWVNDLLLNGKKICGILTESVADGRSQQPAFVIVGIGMNLAPPKEGLPEDLASIAGAVLPSVEQLTEQLFADTAVTLRKRFLQYYQGLREKSYVPQYQAALCMIGKPVTVLENDVERAAVAMAVDDNLRLLVRYENGEEQWRSSGEIRIRL